MFSKRFFRENRSVASITAVADSFGRTAPVKMFMAKPRTELGRAASNRVTFFSPIFA